MGRSQESFNKKEVRNKKEKKRKEKAAKRAARKDGDKQSFDDMIAYVDANGNITSTPPDPAKKEETELEDIAISVPKSEKVEEPTERSGVVSYFNDSKGYGFIRDSISQDTVFVHMNNVDGDLFQGDQVIFETEKGPKGLNAINVKVKK